MKTLLRLDGKRLALNLTLLATVLVMIGSVLEVGVFRMNMHRIPMRFHGHIDRYFYAFAQSSKAVVMPKNYIAIAGDSYAQGEGDWRIEANVWKNPPFASQHVLQELTGQDVINSGAGGGDSLRTLAVRPVAQYRFLNSTLLYRIKKPDIILSYVYEGGLNRSLAFLEQNYLPRYDPARIYDRAYFRQFIDDIVTQSIPTAIARRFVLPRFLLRLWNNFRVRLAKLFPPISPFYGKRTRTDSGAKEVAKSFPDYNSEEGLKLSLYVIQQSLTYLTDFFPEARHYIVYIPDIHTSYEMPVDGTARDNLLPEFLRSDEISDALKIISVAVGSTYIDSRPAIRAASQAGRVHGVIDKAHFNRKGYTVLAETILPYLEGDKTQ
ncbi:MAG: hypothetical protein Q8R76_08355 [Candidatus Omnitrophota bacterium]|nr:hypothetical protein [Candidatus Omnitrophota bacterium]